MMHTIEDHDGLRVLVVTDMGRRFHPTTGLELPARKVDARIVHASAISEFYGIPLNTIGIGDNRIPGIWELVHSNTIGMRVPYNHEGQFRTDRQIRVWEKKFDAAGNPVGNEQKLVTQYYDQEQDDGMYVRYENLVQYAEANGWTKGGGRPKPQAVSGGVDIAAIVAAVMTAMQPKPTHEMTDEKRAEIGQRLAAARAAKRAQADG